jgi:Zn-dependent peptidase ImmA (M78 family)
VVRLPDVRVPEFDDLPPEHAARQLRAAWQLPTGPVPHLVRLAESKGIAVVIAPFGAEQRIDGFSCWSDHLDRPLVCLSSDRANVLRRRFNAAHEIGHIVMHRQAEPGSAEREREANAFAAEFLVPAAEITPLLPHRVDLAALVELQREWGVSVQALLHRSTELGALSDSAAQQGWALISKLGWRRDEPADDLPGEWPTLLSEAVALAAPLGLTAERLAAGLKLPAAEVLELIGHRVDERPTLRLVMPSGDEEVGV